MTFDPRQLVQDITNAKPKRPKLPPYLEDGTHKLALADFRQKMIKDKGPAVFATYVVLESTNPKHPVGSVAVVMFSLYGKFPSYIERAHTDIKAMAEALCGASDAGALNNALMSMFGNPNQARGIVVKCVSTDRNANKPDYDGPVYCDHTFSHVENQTPELIAQVRGYLDTVAPEKPPEAVPAPVAPTPAPVVAAPAPTLLPPQSGTLLPQTPAPAAPAPSPLPFNLPS